LRKEDILQPRFESVQELLGCVDLKQLTAVHQALLTFLAKLP
jgi:hypothetical protein